MTIWKDHPGFALPAVAAGLGPFATADFFDVVDSYDEGEPLAAASDDAFLPLRRTELGIEFAGDPEVTDYHTAFGSGSEELIARIAEEESPRCIRLDSLPEEAAKPLAAGLTSAGWDVEMNVHEVAAVLELPASFDDYLHDIGKKERHEMRRKRRRYERGVGELRHETHHGPGWAFDEFVRLHRMADGAKGSFLHDRHLRLFTDLSLLDGWRLDVLRVDDETAAAIVFGYSDDTGYYLYNSAYDPNLSHGSPGVVLLGSMIETAIGEQLDRFDFLKGDETYKFRLGAQPRHLLEIVATRGDA